MPALANVHGNDPMQQNIVKSLQPDYTTATQLAPNLEAEGVSFTYFEFGREGDQGGVVSQLAPGQRSPLTDIKLTLASGLCKEYGRAAKLPYITNANVPPGVDLRGRLAATCYEEVQLQEEQDLKDLLYTTANYGTTQAVGSNGNWNNATAANVKIRTDLVTLARKISIQGRGKYPNTLVLPPEAWDVVMLDPTLVGYYQNGPNGLQLVVDGFDVPQRFQGFRLVIPGRVKNSANQGQTASYGMVWTYASGAVAILAYINPNPAKETPSFLHNFAPKTYGSDGVLTDSWWDQAEKSWYVDYRECRSFKIVCKEYGGVVTGIYA